MKYTSAIASTASGSQGGTTASRNRFGQYFRRRAVPVQPRTSKQILARQRLSALAMNWSNVLTDIQRASFDTYAANVTKVDKLGMSFKATGFNWYVAMNSVRADLNYSPLLTTAPNIFTLTPLQIVTVIAQDDNQYSIEIPEGAEWNQAGGGLLIGWSGPKNAGVKFIGGPFTKLSQAEGGTVTNVYNGSFSPGTVAAGQRIAFTFRAQAPDGRISNLIRFDTTVLEA